MDPFISFVIPVYNVENYLKHCIESILSQQLDSYEIVMINDGSTDNSAAICEDYVKKYKGIKVKHIKNSGPSAARNIGIKEASGSYIIFIDSDDYYIETTIREFVNIIKTKPKVDIVIGKVYIFYEGTEEIFPKTRYVNLSGVDGLDGLNALEYLIRTGQFIQSVYSYMVRKDLLTNNKILFNENYKSYEDLDFTLNVFLNAKNVYSIDSFFLMYRKNRQGQITYKGNLKRDLAALDVSKYWLDKTNEIMIPEKYKSSIRSYISNCLMFGLGSQYLYSNKEQRIRFAEFKKLQSCFKYATDKRLLPMKLIYRVFGYTALVFFTTYLKKFVRKIKGTL